MMGEKSTFWYVFIKRGFVLSHNQWTILLRLRSYMRSWHLTFVYLQFCHPFAVLGTKWSFGYGTATIADAIGDAIKMKAEHIKDKAQVAVRIFSETWITQLLFVLEKKNFLNMLTWLIFISLYVGFKCYCIRIHISTYILQFFFGSHDFSNRVKHVWILSR